MGKILDKIVFIISLMAIAGLLGAYAARYVDPNTFVLPSLLGLAYPYILISNAILLLYWIARWKKTALLHLIVLAMGIPFFISYYGTKEKKSGQEAYDLSLLSYNVRYFDRYGWSKEAKTKEKLIAYLNRFDGDILCLQEFPPKGYAVSPESLVKALSSYPYHCILKNMAIFSRLPLRNCREISFDKEYTSSCIYCDIIRSKDTVRLYNIHLESYRLGTKERKFVKDITTGNSHDIPNGLKNLGSRISTANKNRAKQARHIKAALQKSPYKLIVCGDFNDTPLSYTYRTITKNLSDSFLEQGRGLGNTYIGEFPSFRIDYIIHSPEFRTVSYNRELVTLSDHYPIVCKLKLPAIAETSSKK